jgi:hypothetical protein
VVVASAALDYAAVLALMEMPKTIDRLYTATFATVCCVISISMYAQTFVVAAATGAAATTVAMMLFGSCLKKLYRDQFPRGTIPALFVTVGNSCQWQSYAA